MRCIAILATALQRRCRRAGNRRRQSARHGRVDGRGVGRLRQRRLRRPVADQVGTPGAVPQRSRVSGFTRVSEQAGLPRWINANTAIWFDYDGDGLLDHVHRRLLLGRHRPLASHHDANHAGEFRVREERRPQDICSTISATANLKKSARKSGIDSRRWALAAAAADLRGTGHPGSVRRQ